MAGLGIEFGVVGGGDQAVAVGQRRAVDGPDDDLDAVGVARRRRAREDARVVLLGVEYRQPVLEVLVAALVRRGPALRVHSAHGGSGSGSGGGSKKNTC